MEMDKKIYEYEKYYDKVLGCFMGKCICGTMGAPYEGMKQWLNLDYEKSMTEKLISNDDLDIQVIWLEVLEKYGENISSIDLADAFYCSYPHCPGEYAYFKKNYSRKIYPPSSGSFNNYFYENGMGSPIRSEIWACVNPCTPEKSIKMARMDGCLDHRHDSIVAEQYLAALQSIAFEYDEVNSEKLLYSMDVYEVLERAAQYLSESSKLERLYTEIRHYYNSGFDIRQIRDLVIREYGHPDCTNLYQNLGIIWSALLLGKGKIIDTAMLAINSGFDTDCTAATVGAILGILLGGKKLKEIFDVDEVYYKAEAIVHREDNKISTLAQDVARVGCYFSRKNLLDVRIDHQNEKSMVLKTRELLYEIKYHAEPVFHDENKVSLFLKNTTNKEMLFTLKGRDKEGCEISIPNQVTVSPMGQVEVPVLIRKNGIQTVSGKTEIFHISVNDGIKGLNIEFGLYHGIKYRVYGPFWENNVKIPQLKPNENYYRYLGNVDEIREYHLGMTCDFSYEYIPEGDWKKIHELNILSKEVLLTKDRFSVSDLFGFEGPCVVYMEREIICENELQCMLYVGKSDRIKIWLNDELLMEDENYSYCTCENRHTALVSLKRGINHMLIKIARSSHEAIFSLLFVRAGKVMDFPEHLLI